MASPVHNSGHTHKRKEQQQEAAIPSVHKCSMQTVSLLLTQGIHIDKGHCERLCKTLIRQKLWKRPMLQAPLRSSPAVLAVLGEQSHSANWTGQQRKMQKNGPGIGRSAQNTGMISLGRNDRVAHCTQRSHEKIGDWHLPLFASVKMLVVTCESRRLWLHRCAFCS